MEILALDYGDARIGYATASRSMRLAFAKGYLKNDGRIKDSLRVLLESLSPKTIVLGLPLKRDLRFTPATDKALLFAEMVFEIAGIDFFLVDERFSTAYSKINLRYSGKTVKDSKLIIDAESAKCIAEIFINDPSWVFKVNRQVLPVQEIRDVIDKSSDSNIYLSGGLGVFEIIKEYKKDYSIFELNPFVYSKQRLKPFPENVKEYLFKFSLPDDKVDE